MESFKKLEEEGNAVFVKGYDQSKAFGSEETGKQPILSILALPGAGVVLW